MNKISRHYSERHLRNATFEMKVAIYEDQVRGWFFDQARILEKASDHAGFVLLLVALSYVEAHAILYRGKDSKNNSRKFFGDSFKAIFQPTDNGSGLLDKAINELYNEVRNGLFHTGMIRKKVILSGDFKSPVQIKGDPKSKDILQIEINPHIALNAIEDHFSHYVMRLRNPDEIKLRENFEKAWTLRTT